MEQQRLLTSSNALNLVLGEVPVSSFSEYAAINYIVGRDYDLTTEERVFYAEIDPDLGLSRSYAEDYGCFYIPAKYIPLLRECADYLQSQGYYVFIRLEFDASVGFYRCDFVVGECARLLDRIYSLANYLNSLNEFVEKHKHELPPNFVVEQNKISEYLDYLWGEYEEVLRLYTDCCELSLEEECKEAWKLLNEVEAYLESIKDLCRVQALATGL
jgi:hypothetical protein